MKHTYILDTNILLDDPHAITSFDDNNIVIPLIVVEEMDRFKDKPGELGVNAREFSRYLGRFISDDLYRLNEGITTEGGGHLRVVTISELSDHGADLSKFPELEDYNGGDNKILQVLLGLTQKARKEGTELPILVTRDIQLRVKCNVLGLRSEDRRKGGLPKKARELYKGIREIRVPWSVVQVINENPTSAELNLNALCLMDNQPEMYPNEFATFVAPDGTGLSQILYRHTGDISTPVVLPKMHKISPRNLEQKATLALLLDPKIKLVTILGKAGSGKSLVSLAAGLEQVLDKRVYKNLFVCRPIQPLGRDIGYLPGSKSEKLEPWLAPVKDNLKFLLSNDSGKFEKRSRTGKGSSKDEGGFAKPPEFSTFDMLVEQGIIEIEAMTYIRGRSIANSYMLIDEVQNISAHELKTILTRVGENTKIVLNGDIEQIDNLFVDSVNNGLSVAVEKFKDQKIAGHITMAKCERSALAEISANILE